MPSNKDPALVGTGHGTALEDSVAESSLNFDFAGGTQQALENHIDDPLDAHDGSAVSIPASLPYVSDDVTGALTELAGSALPPAPNVIGENELDIPNTGYPDWGTLRADGETPPAWLDSPAPKVNEIGAFTDTGVYVPTEFATDAAGTGVIGFVYPADKGVLALYEDTGGGLVAVAAVYLDAIFWEDDTMAPGPVPFPPFPSRESGQANYGPLFGEGLPYYNGTEGQVGGLPQIDIKMRLPALRDYTGLDQVPVAERGRYASAVSGVTLTDYDHDNGAHQIGIFAYPHTLTAGRSTLQVIHFQTMADYTAGPGAGATYSRSAKFTDESGNGDSTVATTTFARVPATGAPDFRTLELPAFLRIKTGNDRGVYEIASITDADTLEISLNFGNGATGADWDIVSQGYLTTIRENVFKDSGVTNPSATAGAYTTPVVAATGSRFISGVDHYGNADAFDTNAASPDVFDDSYFSGNQVGAMDPPEIQNGYLTDPPLEVDYLTGFGRADGSANWDDLGYSLGSPPVPASVGTFAELGWSPGLTEKFGRAAKTQVNWKKPTGESGVTPQTGNSLLVNLTTDYGSIVPSRAASETFIDDVYRWLADGPTMLSLSYPLDQNSAPMASVGVLGTGSTVAPGPPGNTFQDLSGVDFSTLALPAVLRILNGPDAGVYQIAAVSGTTDLIVAGQPFTALTPALNYQVIGNAAGTPWLMPSFAGGPDAYVPTSPLVSEAYGPMLPEMREAQVLGVPSLDTSIGEGRLEYPQIDFSAGHNPTTNPNYSVIPAGDTVGWERHYIRAFNTGLGLRTGTLSIEGIDLTGGPPNFGYDGFPGTAPHLFDAGHGGGVRISVMCPGKTHWLDLGRSYGSPDLNMLREGRGALTAFDEVAGTYQYDLGAGNATFDNGAGEFLLLVRVSIFNPTGLPASVGAINWLP
jgi:hypothetical protein